jgi:hypothetical protein
VMRGRVCGRGACGGVCHRRAGRGYPACPCSCGWPPGSSSA